MGQVERVLSGQDPFDERMIGMVHEDEPAENAEAREPQRVG